MEAGALPDTQAADAGADLEAGASERGTTGRVWAMRGLVTLGAVLLVLGALAVWVKRVVLETPTWGDTSAAVLADPVVQQTLATYLVDQVYDNVDVAGQLGAALPERAKPLAAPAAAGLRELADRGARRALASPRVQDLWREANERANRRLVQLVDGGSGALDTSGGVVALDLHPLVERVAGQSDVGQRIGERLPDDAGRLVVLRSNQLEAAQDAAAALRTIADFVLLLVVAIFAAAVWVAPDRRRAVRACALALVVSGLVLVLVRRVLGDELIDRLVTAESVRPAVHQVWWIVTEQLGLANATILAVGFLGLLGSWVAGPGRRGTAVRRALAPSLRRPGVAYGTLAAVVLILLVWSPTPATRTPVTVVILVVLAVAGLEALRRKAAAEFPDAETGPLAPSLPWRGRPPTGPAAPAGDMRLAAMAQLGELRAGGVLDDDEFAREKARVLAQPSSAV